MTYLLALVILGVLGDGPDPAEIIKKSIEAGEANQKIARNYTYVEREEERDLNSDGSLKKTESHTYEVTLLEGEPYSRLIQKDDKPLSPKEEKKEQEKLDKSIREHDKETPEQRAKRRAKFEKEQEDERKFLREMTSAFDFRMLGDETIDGRAVWVIECIPRPGFKPTMKHGDILAKVRGKLWIDKEGYDWVKGEIEVIDTLSFGLALLRVHKGTQIKFEETRVNDEVWLPKRFFLGGSVRVAYVKGMKGEDISTYRDYKKFQVETKVITEDPRP